MRIRLTVLILASLAAAPALADRVHLKGGRVLEGEVEQAADGSVVVKTASGAEARIPANRVLRVEKAPTPAAQADARRAALAADDLAGHHALAEWCEEKGLRKRARALRERILARWPNDPKTRKALDHVRHEGEWLTRGEYMERIGMVRSPDGKTWITRERAAALAGEERDAVRRKEVERLLRRASYKDPVEVEQALRGYEDAAAVPALLDKVRGTNVAARRLAMRELGRRRAKAAELHLARAAVEDTKKAARQEALDALMKLKPEKAPDYFLRSVTRRKNPFQRVHAVQAVGAFPGPSAVPVLIRALRETTSNFPRANISVTTQRAYIQDFELSSGGTGNVVAEVADPQIGTFTEGVTLEMKVIQWERTTVVQVLRRLTGQRFGADPGAWERWWKDR